MTRKLTIAGAFLLMVGLLATFGNADDVPTPTAPAPASIQVSQTGSPIILAEKESVTAPEVVAEDTTSVLRVTAPETDLLLPESVGSDSALTEIAPEEPMLFAPPTELEFSTSPDTPDAFVPTEASNTDAFPVSSGTEIEAPQANAPIVTPDSEGLEFQVFSDQGSVLPTPTTDDVVPTFDSQEATINAGMQKINVQAPAVTVSSQGPTVVRVGETGEYVITATNGGTSIAEDLFLVCLLYTSPSPRDQRGSSMAASA